MQAHTRPAGLEPGERKKMTLLDLLEKAKKEYALTGIPHLLKIWITEFNSEQTSFYKIQGFLWALEMTGYITEKEHEEIDDDIFNNLRS